MNLEGLHIYVGIVEAELDKKDPGYRHRIYTNEDETEYRFRVEARSLFSDSTKIAGTAMNRYTFDNLSGRVLTDILVDELLRELGVKNDESVTKFDHDFFGKIASSVSKKLREVCGDSHTYAVSAKIFQKHNEIQFQAEVGTPGTSTKKTVLFDSFRYTFHDFDIFRESTTDDVVNALAAEIDRYFKEEK